MNEQDKQDRLALQPGGNFGTLRAVQEKSNIRDLVAYGLLVIVSAGLITGTGLYLLYRQSEQEKLRERENHNARIAERAGNLQDAIRDAESDPQARTYALAALVGTGDTPSPIAAFSWEPKVGILWEQGLSASLLKHFSKFTGWTDWKSPTAKHPRRGLMELRDDGGTPWFVLWGRVDKTIYALVYAASPVEMEYRSWLWPAGAGFGLLLFAILVVAGWLTVLAAKRARQADAMKTTFVSNVSHELKTPLAAIRIWTDMLSAGRIDSEEKRRRALAVISDENGRMIRLVDNLLDFARLAQQRKTYSLAEVDLAALARESVDFMAGAFAENGISCAGDDRVPTLADADAVRQILVNLLGNAAKYAAAMGPVEVRVSADGAVARVDVADRGPGMSRDAMAHAFDRFYRAASASANGAGGFGLGLSISRALARDMGGDITASPRDGGGITFSLSLPARTA